MPSLWDFLREQKSPKVKDHAYFTLQKIAQGGIYDHIGGGFTRYSVDAFWLVPHFEKMLYDNGQLLSLYAKAYKETKNEEFLKVENEIVTWLEREMKSPNGGFYSALDADSEGEEGKFYVWDIKEIEASFGDESPLFCSYFNITEKGNWELRKNIPFTTTTESDFAKQHEIDPASFSDKVQYWKNTLLEKRNARIRPSLDDKILLSWNAMTVTGLFDAYLVSENVAFKDLALETLEFLKISFTQGDSLKLFHTHKDGKSKIDGFLDDYAFLIQAYIKAYQCTAQPNWLMEAKSLTDFCIENFWDESDQLFYFSSNEDLIARNKEIFDNVIPSSNSVMAHNLWTLHQYFEIEDYSFKALAMVKKVAGLMQKAPTHMSHWAHLVSRINSPSLQLVVVGPDAEQKISRLFQALPSYALIAGEQQENSEIALLQHRNAINGETAFYVCKGKSCLAPTTDITEALDAIADNHH